MLRKKGLKGGKQDRLFVLDSAFDYTLNHI